MRETGPLKAIVCTYRLAKYLGVDRHTIDNWRKSVPDFPKAKRILRRDYFVTAEVLEYFRLNKMVREVVHVVPA
jgi:hypothetical protein